MNEQYNVLVVDDKEINRESAGLLSTEGRTLDTASTFLEAIKLLGHKEYGDEDRDLKKYDAVLTDMMFPLGGTRGELIGMANDWERQDENPLGYALALYAAKQGVPLIGILTDMNHHSGPIAATFDLFYTGGRGRPTFSLNKSKLMLFDERDLGNVYSLKEGGFSHEAPWNLADEEKNNFVRTGEYGYATAKNWGALLEKLGGEK